MPGISASSPAIPIFKLYGESHEWHTPDLIHCESVAERSRLHNWEIKPHRHSELVQLLYVQRGQARVQLDGSEHILQPPCVLLIARMCIHGFRFSRDVEGYVLSLAAPLLNQLGDSLGRRQNILLNTQYCAVGEDSPLFDTLFATLNREYRQTAPGRELLLESMVNALMILFSRYAYRREENREQIQDRSGRHFARFSQLVEQRYKTHCPLEEYAGVLSITSAHLNALCQRHAGRSALHIVHERLLLEAKRYLIYTTLTIGEVSDSLGFSEPAYFTRFFKRLSGSSPRAFRRAGGTRG